MKSFTESWGSETGILKLHKNSDKKDKNHG